MAEDEPRCEQLRNENSTLQAKMIATKEFQIAVVKEVENLKAEKTSLIKRKAGGRRHVPYIPHLPSSAGGTQWRGCERFRYHCSNTIAHRSIS